MKVTKGAGGTGRTEKGAVVVTACVLQVGSGWVQLLLGLPEQEIIRSIMKQQNKVNK